MTTSTDLASLFGMSAPENTVVVDARILIPELEAATLTVLSAEISAPEARSWGEKTFMSSQLALTFLVDDETARAETMQDEPKLFHYVRVNCTPEGGFDWTNNIDLIKFFVALGVKVYEGKGKARVYVDNPLVWAADAVGRSLTGKIIHEPVRAKDENGEWNAYKMDEEGEPVMKNKLSAFSALV